MDPTTTTGSDEPHKQATPTEFDTASTTGKSQPWRSWEATELCAMAKQPEKHWVKNTSGLASRTKLRWETKSVVKCTMTATLLWLLQGAEAVLKYEDDEMPVEQQWEQDAPPVNGSICQSLWTLLILWSILSCGIFHGVERGITKCRKRFAKNRQTEKGTQTDESGDTRSPQPPTKSLPEVVYFTQCGQKYHISQQCHGLRNRLHQLQSRSLCSFCNATSSRTESNT